MASLEELLLEGLLAYSCWGTKYLLEVHLKAADVADIAVDAAAAAAVIVAVADDIVAAAVVDC